MGAGKRLPRFSGLVRLIIAVQAIGLTAVSRAEFVPIDSLQDMPGGVFYDIRSLVVGAWTGAETCAPWDKEFQRDIGSPRRTQMFLTFEAKECAKC